MATAMFSPLSTGGGSGSGGGSSYTPSMYWLVSLPLDRTTSRESAWSRLNDKTAMDADLATNYKFIIPELRVGTLDSLLQLSDDLVRVTNQVETTCNKIKKQLYDTADEDNSLFGSPVESLLTRFSWDEAKYPVRRPLQDTKDNIVETVSRLDEDFKIRMGDYSLTKNRYSSIVRKQQGGLAVRDMESIILGDKANGSAEQISRALSNVIDTENLVTLFVVVVSHMKHDWFSKYETLSSDVVPRSSTLVAKDESNEMYSVVMFRRVADSFKTAAQHNNFIVRTFDKRKYLENLNSGTDEQDSVDGGNRGRSSDSRAAAEMAMREQEGKLYEWCLASYTECFSAWMHIYAIRVYVESILRYGLPPNFLVVVMKPNSVTNKKNESKVRAILNDSCISHQKSSKFWNKDAEDSKAVVAGASEGDYQYVSYSIVA